MKIHLGHVCAVMAVLCLGIVIINQWRFPTTAPAPAIAEAAKGRKIQVDTLLMLRNATLARVWCDGKNRVYLPGPNMIEHIFVLPNNKSCGGDN